MLFALPGSLYFFVRELSAHCHNRRMGNCLYNFIEMKGNRPSTVQLLEVTVERILPFGVFVRLPDGAPGYIRRRELDLDADVEPSEVVRRDPGICPPLVRFDLRPKGYGSFISVLISDKRNAGNI